MKLHVRIQANAFLRRFVAVGLMAVSLNIEGCSRAPKQVIATDPNGKKIVGSDVLNPGSTQLVGDFNAIIRVTYCDGNPGANLSYRLERPSGSSTALVATGTLSNDGTATVEGLAGADPAVIYNLTVDEQPLGIVAVGLNRERNQFEFLLPAKAGMKAPTLAMRDLNSKESFTLADLQGQIVVLEFYTTNCAPCQPALAKLNQLLEGRGETWKGKVAVLAVGLDAVQQPNVSAEVIAKHLRARKWQHLRAIVPDEVFSWEPRKRFPFGVSGVPHCFIIGRDGTILWAGHPNALDLERRLQEVVQVGGTS